MSRTLSDSQETQTNQEEMLFTLLVSAALKQTEIPLVSSPSKRYTLLFVSKHKIRDLAETVDLQGRIMLEDGLTKRRYWVEKENDGGVTTQKYPISFEYGASPDNRLLFMWCNGRFETTSLYAVDTKLHKSFALLNKNFDAAMKTAIAQKKGPFKKADLDDISFSVLEEDALHFHTNGFEVDWQAGFGFGSDDQRAEYFRAFYKRSKNFTIELDHIAAIPTPKDLE